MSISGVNNGARTTLYTAANTGKSVHVTHNSQIMSIFSDAGASHGENLDGSACDKSLVHSCWCCCCGCWCGNTTFFEYCISICRCSVSANMRVLVAEEGAAGAGGAAMLWPPKRSRTCPVSSTLFFLLDVAKSTLSKILLITAVFRRVLHLHTQSMQTLEIPSYIYTRHNVWVCNAHNPHMTRQKAKESST